MPATMRPVSAAFRKTEPGPFAGFFIGALALTIVVETTLSSNPRIDLIERSGTNWVTLRFDTDANRTYTLQYSSGVNSGTWSNIYTILSDPLPHHYVVVVPATNGSGFYRLALTP